MWRSAFKASAASHDVTMGELCAALKISRQAFYKKVGKACPQWTEEQNKVLHDLLGGNPCENGLLKDI